VCVLCVVFVCVCVCVCCVCVCVVCVCVCVYGPGSSVALAIELRPGRSGIKSRWGRDFPPLRPALGPTQPSLKWVPGLSRGKVRPGHAAGHSPFLVPRSWKSRTINLPTIWATFLYAYMYWSGSKVKFIKVLFIHQLMH